MIKLLDHALEVARDLPPDVQDDIARTVLLTAEERAAIAKSKAAADRGELATDEQVRSIRGKHGL
jgi:hypothetical protein